MKFSLDTVRAVAQLLDEAQLSEIAVESTDEQAPGRLFVRREVVLIGAESVEGAPLLESAPPAAGAESGDAPKPTSTLVPVLAPVVGFFRHAVKPVAEGTQVHAGQNVGIVESLRVPNEVLAPVAGRVVELRVQEGQGVEYHQELFVIEPDSSDSLAEASS